MINNTEKDAIDFLISFQKFTLKRSLQLNILFCFSQYKKHFLENFPFVFFIAYAKKYTRIPKTLFPTVTSGILYCTCVVKKRRQHEGQIGLILLSTEIPC